MNIFSKFTFISRALFMTILVFGFFSVSDRVQAYTYTGVLQLGSHGSQVVSLQQRLGISPASGDFDYTTRGAVVAFQLSRNITADGVVGPTTGRLLAIAIPTPAPTPSPTPTPSYNPTPVPSSYPPGCTADTLFSATTGKSCKVTTSTSQYQAGCNSTYGYSITTGLRCSIPVGCVTDSDKEFSTVTGESCDHVALRIFPGCTTHSGYSATTGASCLSGVTTSPLVGIDGHLDHFKKVVGYTNSRSIRENSTNANIAGYIVTGEKYSDIRLTQMSLKIELTDGDGSDNLSKYAKAIHVLQNGNKVGTLDVSDFSNKNSTYTAKIPLYGAVARSDQDAYFYIATDSVENISSANEENTWTVTVTEIRYMNGRGASFSESSKDDIGSDGSTDFHFLPIK